MFGKVKKILGIEGVKVQLQSDNQFSLQSGLITGHLKITTKTQSWIESIEVRLIEKYSRGRGDKKLVDEYVIGVLQMNEKMSILPEEIIEVPFELHFTYIKSEAEKIGEDFFVLRGPVYLAKMLKNVKSEFKIEVRVNVEGLKLQPFAEKPLLAKP